MAGQILDLNTLVDRPKINIVSKKHPDGRLYELKLPDELGVIDHQQIAHLAGDARKLADKDPDKLTAKESRLLADALNRATSIVLPEVEPDVLKALSDPQKLRVIDVWHDLMPAKGEGGDGPPPTGDA